MHTLWVFLGEVWHVARRRPMAASVGLLGNIYFITVSVIVPLLVGRVIELATPGGSRESLMQIAAVWAGIVVRGLPPTFSLSTAIKLAGSLSGRFTFRR